MHATSTPSLSPLSLAVSTRVDPYGTPFRAGRPVGGFQPAVDVDWVHRVPVLWYHGQYTPRTPYVQARGLVWARPAAFTVAPVLAVDAARAAGVKGVKVDNRGLPSYGIEAFTADDCGASDWCRAGGWRGALEEGLESLLYSLEPGCRAALVCATVGAPHTPHTGLEIIRSPDGTAWLLDCGHTPGAGQGVSDRFGFGAWTTPARVAREVVERVSDHATAPVVIRLQFRAWRAAAVEAAAGLQTASRAAHAHNLSRTGRRKVRRAVA